MCGIIAVVSDAKIKLAESLSKIKHRGPDATGEYYTIIEDYHVSLGHVRLSIIDLDESSNQPFESKCGQYALVFNGEIYNYKKIREQLKIEGSSFDTNSDTEVLLKAYIAWGTASFDTLNGMFAYVLLDKVNNKFFVVRDQLGIKPIYYSYDESTSLLCVSSEIKGFSPLGINPKINPADFYEFMANNWLYEPDTGFENIRKVRPGGYLEFDIIKKDLVETIYFDLLSTQNKKNKFCQMKIENTISSEINLQLNADVPLGIFYSGGNDSALIAAESKNLGKNVSALFSQYSKKDIKLCGIADDSPFASEIANQLDLNLQKYHFNYDSYGSTLDEIIASSVALNEVLNADFTCLSSNMISDKARAANFKVMLSGMGADEIFSGYPRYILFRSFKFFFISSYFIKPFKNLLRKVPSFSKKVDRFFNIMNVFKKASFPEFYSYIIGSCSKIELDSMFKSDEFSVNAQQKYSGFDEKVKDLSLLKKALYMDFHGFLSHNFSVADKSSMDKSIEMRVPLATKDLALLMFNCPDKMLCKRFKTKPVLKKRLSKFIDNKLVNRRKTGFNPPLDQLLNSTSPANIKSKLNNLGAYMNIEYLESLVDEHYSGVRNRSYQLLQLLYLEKWVSTYN